MREIRWILQQATTAFEADDYDQAAQAVGSLEQRETTGQTRLSPGVLGKLANAHADLGGKYHALGLYAQAIGEFDQALGLCPAVPAHRPRCCVPWNSTRTTSMPT